MILHPEPTKISDSSADSTETSSSIYHPTKAKRSQLTLFCILSTDDPPDTHYENSIQVLKY